MKQEYFQWVYYAFCYRLMVLHRVLNIVLESFPKMKGFGRGISKLSCFIHESQYNRFMSNKIIIKTLEQITGIRKASRLTHDVLDMISPYVKA